MCVAPEPQRVERLLTASCRGPFVQSTPAVREQQSTWAASVVQSYAGGIATCADCQFADAMER
jgi:hypothetical protein